MKHVVNLASMSSAPHAQARANIASMHAQIIIELLEVALATNIVF
jgi:hypothetical protein